jgi:hypothetical protein
MQAIQSILGTRKLEIKHPRTPRKKTQLETDNIADYLIDKFQSPEFKPIFLRTAWRLDRGTIDRYVSAAFELGNNPRAYFISLVKKDINY